MAVLFILCAIWSPAIEALEAIGAYSTQNICMHIHIHTYVVRYIYTYKYTYIHIDI